MARDGSRPLVLIADDDSSVRDVLAALCRALGWETAAVSSGSEAVGEALRLAPDVVLMDAMMPGMDGFEATRLLKSDERTAAIPVLILSGLRSREDRLRGIAMGANDFLTKPVDSEELELRLKNHLKIKQFHDFLRDHAAILEREVAERTRELQAALEGLEAARDRIAASHRDTILRLAALAEFRDEDTGAHVRRIGAFSSEIAENIGLGSEFCDAIRYAAVMHDIGKVSIPDHILLKPAPLTEPEWQVMKSHTVAGARILAGSDSPYLAMGEQIALAHHEHWDGTGYPRGLSGDSIALPARIVQLADQYDALRSARPYKSPVAHEEAVGVIQRGDGRTLPSHFDPEVLAAFARIAPRFQEIYEELKDESEGDPSRWREPPH